jgi:cytochrome c-type biogenesis protein CcmH
VKALIASMGTLVALALPAAAVAAECTKTSVADLEDEVMCPVCGTSLGLAREAPQARRERAYIARLVRRCHSKDEIKAALVAQFGDGILALPDDEGFNLSAYLAPLLAMLIAGTLTGLALVRWRRTGTRATSTVAAGRLKEEEVRRLDTEIRLEER